MLYRVINCRSSKSRLEAFRKAADRAGVKVPRMPCVDGRRFSDRRLASFHAEGLVNRRSGVTPIELAISLSHRKCWEQLVRSRSDAMMILEDDVRMMRGFKKTVDAIFEAELQWDVFYLYNGNWAHTRSRQRRVGRLSTGADVYQEPRGHVPGTVCYIITKAFARRLLREFAPVHDPVDVYMGERRGARALTLRPTPAPCITHVPRVLRTNCPDRDTARSHVIQEPTVAERLSS